MTVVSNKQRSTKLLRFAKSGRNVSVTSYFKGDVTGEAKVVVDKDGTVVGDVVAPKVDIAGIVCGVVAAKSVHFRATAQVWGDIYAQNIRLDKGAKLHGWFSVIDETGYEMLQTDIENMPEAPKNPFDFDQHQSDSSPRQRMAMRRIQQEAAVAVATYAELTETIQNKEAAGEPENLQQQLEQAEQDQELLTGQLDDLKARLSVRDSELASLELELSQLRSERSQQLEKTEQLTEQLAEQSQEQGKLHLEKSSIERNLEEALLNLEGLSSLAKNAENEMPANGDQQNSTPEAMIRWQELAERRGAEIDRLSQQTATFEEQITRGEELANQLQSKLDQRIQTLDLIQEERDALHFQNEELQAQTHRLAKLRAEAAQWQENAEKAATRLAESEAQQSELAASTAEAEANVKRLEERINEMQEQLRQSQIPLEEWRDKFNQKSASVEETSQQIVELQAQKSVLNERLQNLEERLAEQQQKHALELKENAAEFVNQMEEKQEIWLTEMSVARDEFEAHLANRQADVTKLEETLAEQENSGNAQLAQLQSQLDQLKKENETLTTESQESQQLYDMQVDQFNWARTLLQEQEIELEEWRQNANKNLVTGKKWRANAASLSKIVHQLEDKLKSLETMAMDDRSAFEQELAQQAQDFKADLMQATQDKEQAEQALQLEIRRLTTLQQVNQVELDHLQTAIETQGAKYSRIQLSLVDRDAELAVAIKERDRTKEELEAAKKDAAFRIEELGGLLQESNRRLKEMMAYLDRRADREAKKEAAQLMDVGTGFFEEE